MVVNYKKHLKGVTGIRIREEIDESRTRELNISELRVISSEGTNVHFYCIPSHEIRKCPKCGGIKLRDQGIRSRDFLDAIPRDDDAVVITITVVFRKYKCSAPGCGTVFSPSFAFANSYSRMTHRLENAIVRMVMEDGLSFTNISYLVEEKIGKQVAWETYKRRYKELEDNPDEQPKWFKDLLDESPVAHAMRVLYYRKLWREYYSTQMGYLRYIGGM